VPCAPAPTAWPRGSSRFSSRLGRPCAPAPATPCAHREPLGPCGPSARLHCARPRRGHPRGMRSRREVGPPPPPPVPAVGGRNASIPPPRHRAPLVRRRGGGLPPIEVGCGALYPPLPSDPGYHAVLFWCVPDLSRERVSRPPPGGRVSP